MKEMMSQAEVYVYEDNKMIQDVDHCTVISSHVIDSPILGAITPRELSGGVKVLILIEISKIHPFKNHPFKVLDDEKMQDLVESVKINGVLTPVLLLLRMLQV